ncbi:hypothetical protein M0802_004702 [Mischocyttarus mexicanus]|nr:hypothetical protein M0802_004702 [Mischocyttarus mexicanus]
MVGRCGDLSIEKASVAPPLRRKTFCCPGVTSLSVNDGKAKSTEHDAITEHGGDSCLQQYVYAKVIGCLSVGGTSEKRADFEN